MDTPVINGTPYPVLHVAPSAYRFQILSAANDRGWNLSWFLAATPTGTVCNGTQPAGSACTEVNMVPAVTPPAGSPTPLCTTAIPITNSNVTTGLASALLDSTGAPLNGTGLPANCWPSTWPLTAGITSAGLTGIVPDPRYAGPAWVQIGTEGGLLPAPVVIPATPTLYETNTKSITVGSVATHGLWLGPAERADVIVDFSAFAGKTLILYNDGPAPIPGYDIRNDYYTGDADQTSVGGAPPTQPGYGPNTRTIMQVIVDQVNPNAPLAYNLNTLKAAFATTGTTTGIFPATQPVPVVPEPDYNFAYNKTYTGNYFSVPDHYISYVNFDGSLPGIVVTAGGTGYTTAPAIGFTGATCTTTPVATATVAGGVVTAINLTNPGVCATAPTVTISGPGTGATAISGSVLLRKAIQELFTPDYGRMNATLGTELPLTNFTTQTTIPLAYVDPPTEIFKPNETQVWRITHNGVDTHLIHFHLFNVQIINRIGWDNTLRKPDANEVGWKDTVKMNPLEDVVVALRPIQPDMSAFFPMPDSVRNLDVTMNAGTTGQFTGLDPFTNLPITVINQPVNFGWEYVWHCHILGHEENDMMRPMVFQVPPETPSGLSAVLKTTAPTGVTLNWTNNSVSATSFTIQRALDAGFTVGLTNLTLGTPTMDANPLPRGATTFTDTTVAPATPYFYRVAATKTFPARQSPVWTIPPQTENISSPSIGPVSITSGGLNLTAAPSSPTTVGRTITFTAAMGGAGNFEYRFFWRTATGTWTQGQAYSTTATWNWNTAALALPAGTYYIQVYARHVGNTVAFEAAKAISYTLSLPASGVTLTPSVASPQPVGATITMTAAGQGGSGIYEYRFFWKTATGSWTQGQAYSTTATWNWNTAALALPTGTYYIQVYARNAGSTAAFEAANSMSFTLGSPTSGVTLTPSVASPQLHGATISMTAAGQGGSGNYEYSFFWRTATGTWTLGRAYSTTATWNWNTAALALPAGTYYLQVYARNVGSIAAFEAAKAISYILN
jgi:FtsP/CotA-like multicopper oxidase with cupredoxin domain